MTRRFLPLAAVVLVPVGVLAGFSWRGIQAQRRTARVEAMESAAQWAEVQAGRLSRQFPAAHQRESARRFQDPPVPAEGVAGLSPAGLPLRVIAAFRRFDQSKTDADAEVLLHLAVEEEPSALTPLALAHIPNVPAATRERWEQIEAAHDVRRRHPEITADGSWLLDGGELWWMADEGETIRFIRFGNPSTSLPDAINPQRPWETLRLTLHGKPLDDSRGTVLARHEVSPRGGLAVEVIATDPTQIDAAILRQGRLTFGVLGIAVAVAIAGLYFIHRLMLRERRLGELKSHFVASVSHELRAPIGSIRLMADALDAGKVAPETAAEFHRLISQEGKRLSHLIENVLDFARIEQGRKRWHFEPVDLPSLIADTVKVMEPLAAEKHLHLITVLPDSPTEPVLDAAAIQQALVNLLDNAIKFSPLGSAIETRLSCDPGFCRLAVRDEGPGVPSSERAKIFERFYRPGNELRRETQGTGIGLSLVKAIVEAHGGRVELDSRPGDGSTFTLVLPHDATAGH
jgi:signal transduction histidine kinase